MAEESTRLDEILSDGYAEGIESLPIDELRTMKRECDEEEAALSYARRLLQGKIDLLRAELTNRNGEPANGDDASPADIAEVLGSSGPREFRGRIPRILVPPETRETRRVLALLAEPTMVSLETVRDDELQDAEARLAAMESEISEIRSRVHVQIDVVESEIARRYADGEIDVNEILSR